MRETPLPHRVLECRLAVFGGAWGNGSGAGLSFWRLSDSSGYRNANHGRQTLIRLLYLCCTLLSLPLGKNTSKEQGLVAKLKDLETNKKGTDLKSKGYIYDKVYNLENIKEAISNASAGKRHQKRVKKVLNNTDFYANKIQKKLINKTYKPSKPIIKVIKDVSSGKIRKIYKPNFYPDQIVHWALMQQLQPIIMKGMYEYSCGSVPNRGTTYGQKAIRKWLDKDRKNTKWCLKMDVKKFYPSIDNEKLKGTFRRKIKDPNCLWLIDAIIDSVEGQPIGYFTAQWFSNLFLEELDHFVKERLGVKYYVRYVDDLVLLGSNKRKLHKVRKFVEAYLRSIKLELKNNWQVFKVSDRGVDFLGLRFFENKTILRKKTALRIKRRVNKISKKGYLNERDASAIISYWGWVKRSDSYHFYHKYIKPIISIKLARKVVSVNAKIRANQEREATSQQEYVARL